MIKSYQYLDIDINKKTYKRLRAVQGDSKSRYILVSLYDNSKVYNLSNCSVKVFGCKSDKKIFFNYAIVTDVINGKFEIELTNQALAVAGELEIQILILGTNQERLTSFSFYIDVEKSIVNDGVIESANEFKALTGALSQVEEWNGYFEETSGKIEEKYTERLNNVDSQLEHIDNKKLDKSGIVTMANMGQDVKEAMTGGSVAVVDVDTILECNIVDNQVTHRKLGNDVLKFQDVNLITNTRMGYFVNWNDGQLVENAEYIYTDFIKINSLNNLYCKVNTHYAFYNTNKEFIKGVQGVIDNNIVTQEIEIPLEACYIRLSTKKMHEEIFILSNNESFINNQNYIIKNELNGRKIILDGEWIVNPNQIKEKVINSNHVDPSICTFIKGKNKFNQKTITDGMFVNWTTGGLQQNIEYVTSDYIEVYEGQQIRQNCLTHYAFYDANRGFITGNRDEGTPDPFIVPSGANYLRVSIKKTTFDYTKYMLTLDEELGEFEEFCYKINEEQGKVILESSKQETVNSRFYGKKVSWYGTSITQGYSWCKLVNKYFNFNATNNGVGGTTISRESDDSSMCTKNRMKGLYGGVYDDNTGQTTYDGVAIPSDVEVIFIEGGTNDWARNWEIGNKEFSETPNDQTFAGACHLMFKNMTELFPNAEIIVVGSPFGKLANRNVFNNKYGLLNNNNLQSIEYGDILLDIAGKWGIKGINMGREMQVHDNNVATLIPDGLHLTTTEVQEKASNVVINYLLSLN